MRLRKYGLVIVLGCLILGSVAAFPISGDILRSSFSNKIETGSSMNMKTANLNTETSGRFITNSAGSGVEIYNSITISPYSSDIPSKGSVTAFIKGSSKEGGRAKYTSYPLTIPGDFNPYTGTWNTSTISKPVYEDPSDLYQVMSFFDSISVSGDIISFSKSMSYRSEFI